ncbi:SDR family NAD(P)-dependent oxidoreductase [Hydrocarboniphaga effusa]|uniref:SDR family NAD(P)-dependent oxidoreductase n=1 Tax=Hydrocarboniphaga effusa TaxID=243629 RepID=UPI00398C01F2
MSTSGKRLESRVAIVSGAGCRGEGLGNGQAIALLLAREGAQLLLVDRDAQALDNSLAKLRNEGLRAEGFVADVADGDDVRRVTRLAETRFGRIDILVNNVGISSRGGLFESDEAEWDRCFSVNVRSVFVAARAVVPIMRRQAHGRIVNVSSIAALRTTTAPPHAYAASKAALGMLTKTLAAEFAADGIRCNSVVPGMIDTPMVRDSLLASGLDEAQVRRYTEARHRLSPTGRQGTAWDIANAALFLASEAADYVNGHELVVDGGFTNLSAPAG